MQAPPRNWKYKWCRATEVFNWPNYLHTKTDISPLWTERLKIFPWWNCLAQRKLLHNRSSPVFRLVFGVGPRMSEKWSSCSWNRTDFNQAPVFILWRYQLQVDHTTVVSSFHCRRNPLFGPVAEGKYSRFDCCRRLVQFFLCVILEDERRWGHSSVQVFPCG